MSRISVSVIDYGMGNVWSVISALKYLGAEAVLVSDPEKILKCNCVILPGVGSFRKGMLLLKEKGLDEAIKEVINNGDTCILGICLGMQLLGSHSTEDGQTDGLSLIPNKVDMFSKKEIGQNKLPHVGFNPDYFNERSGLFRDIPELSDFYFTHSYRMHVEGLNGRYATCSYGVEFLAAFESDNICGSQFHPEKSQTNGLVLLKNFLDKSLAC